MDSQSGELLKPTVSADDHTLGPADAPITLVEYGDYACPYCTETYPAVEKLRNDLGEELRFAYRHFPVSSPARSRRAAEAAEAAAEQNHFWEMHDLLSQEPGAHLTEDRLFELARSLDLDIAAFGSTLRQNLHSSRIEKALQSGRQSKVDRTPSFFVNGKPFQDPLQAEKLLNFAELDEPGPDLFRKT